VAGRFQSFVTLTPDRVPTAVPDTRGKRLRLVLVLGAFTALGPLTIDMYLPALPTIGAELQASSTIVQLTLTGTLLGLGLGQLIVGPLSDRLGRRMPLLVGTAVHVLASALCLIAPTIAVLGGLRVLQGLGAAAGAVIALAMVRDLYTGRAAATLLSRLILVMGVSPVIAPTLGGLILEFTSWRGIFALLAVLGLVLIAVAARALPESLQPEHRRTEGLLGTLRTYGGLLRDRTFLGLVLVAGLALAAVLAYVSGASFVFQEQYHVTQQQFGLIFGSGAIWLIAATQLNPVLLRRFEPRNILLGAVIAGSVAGLFLLGIALLNLDGLIGVLLALWLVLFAVGLALPNAPAVALSRHGETAGTAAALLGAVQFGVGALVSPLVGVLGNNAVGMSTVVAGGLVLSMLVLVTVVRPWRLDDIEPAAVAVPAVTH
jgi:DHA1 family bicyclomycin/chloramphenicol resistance-like MFS transporter